MNGVLNVFKERGMTSRDVVDRVRRFYGTRKVGHGGTLDPEVAGVLPVLINRATKISDYLHMEKKEYIAEVTLGEKRDTDDFTGRVQRKDPVANYSLEAIEEVLLSFIGKNMQVPPIYSAKRVKGKRLYEYARQGIDIEIEPSEIEIYELEIYKFDPEAKTILYRVECSKGTYIRSLCRDIGARLNTSGYMSYLLRTESSGLRVEDALSLNRIAQMSLEEKRRALIPMDQALPNLKSIDLGRDKHFSLANGQSIKLENQTANERGIFKVYAGDFIGIGQTSTKGNETLIKIIKRLEI